MLDKMVSLVFVAAALITGSHCFTVTDRSDCTDIKANAIGYLPSNGRYLLLVGEGRRSRFAYCDMTTDDGGWTVIQKRVDAIQTFNMSWTQYENGFGDVTSSHWLGLKYIHSMTYGKRYVLRVEFTDWAGIKHYAEYDNFKVGGAGCNYTLESLGNFCGDCGDSLTAQLNSKFSTYDRDNDNNPIKSCSTLFKGAWWYKDCHSSNLNGEYKIGGPHATYADGINWATCGGYNYSYKTTVMMIRPYAF